MSGDGTGPMRTSVHRSESAVVVSLAGELDLATGEQLRAQLAGVVQGEPAPARVVLDLSELEFVDASGIAVLLSAQRALAAQGRQLVLRSPTRLVRRVVKVLELEDALPLEG